VRIKKIGVIFCLFFQAVFMFNYFNVPLAKADSETLKVGMELAYAPYNFMQATPNQRTVEVNGGYANGYDVQIAKKIAEGMGKNLEIVATQWDGLLPGLTSKKIDIICAGMSPTNERRRTIYFSDYYYTSEITVVVKKDSKYANAQSLSDLVGAKITGQLGTLVYNYVDQIPDVNKQPAMDDFPTMITGVQSGKIDGYIGEYPAAASAAVANPDLKVLEFSKDKGFNVSKDQSSIAVGIKKGNNDLLNQVNEILSNIPQDERDTMMDQAIKDSQNSASGLENSSQEKSFWENVTNIIQHYGGMFLRGLWVTLLISLTGTIFGLIIGLIVACIRYIPYQTDSQGKKRKNISNLIRVIINAILKIYIEVFRGTPMIVQATIIYFGADEALGIDMNPLFAAIMIISINTGAYLSEIVRGGIESINKGQTEGAVSLGLSRFQTMTKIILPQAIRNIMPAIGNEFVINIKDSAVLNVISVTELFFVTKTIKGATYQTYIPYLITAAIYLVITLSVTQILKYIEKRMDRSKAIIAKEITLEE
jgi:putative lysine transport system permease protein